MCAVFTDLLIFVDILLDFVVTCVHTLPRRIR